MRVALLLDYDVEIPHRMSRKAINQSIKGPQEAARAEAAQATGDGSNISGGPKRGAWPLFFKYIFSGYKRSVGVCCGRETNAGKGEATSHHHHRGQQTLRHEVTRAWGGCERVATALACATRSFSTPFTLACEKAVEKTPPQASPLVGKEERYPGT